MGCKLEGVAGRVRQTLIYERFVTQVDVDLT